MEQDSHELGVTLPFPAAGELRGRPFLEAISPSMRAVEGVIRELAHSSVPVLLLGERGTGKKAIAQRIHENSGGATGAFVAKHCRSLSAETLALDSFPAGATLYLDEISDLTPESQKKLLYALSQPAANGSSRKD